MRSVSLTARALAFAVLALVLTAKPAAAGFIVSLDQSNLNLPAGTYATVQGTALDSNTMQFIVTPNDAFWGNPNNVTIFGFGFNNDASLTGNLTFNLPTGWDSQGSGNMDGFGVFVSRVRDTGSQDDQDPLTFTVNTANNFASLAAMEAAFRNLSESNGGSGNGGHEFAAHMRGFGDSGFFTDSGGGGPPPPPPPPNPVPAPMGIFLFAAALPALGVRAWFNRKS